MPARPARTSRAARSLLPPAGVYALRIWQPGPQVGGERPAGAGPLEQLQHRRPDPGRFVVLGRPGDPLGRAVAGRALHLAQPVAVLDVDVGGGGGVGPPTGRRAVPVVAVQELRALAHGAPTWRVSVTPAAPAASSTAGTGAGQ